MELRQIPSHLVDASRWFAKPQPDPQERVRRWVLLWILMLSAGLDLFFLVWVLPTVYGSYAA